MTAPMNEADFYQLIEAVEDHRDEVATWLPLVAGEVDGKRVADPAEVEGIRSLLKVLEDALVTRDRAALLQAEAAYRANTFFAASPAAAAPATTAPSEAALTQAAADLAEAVMGGDQHGLKTLRLKVAPRLRQIVTDALKTTEGTEALTYLVLKRHPKAADRDFIELVFQGQGKPGDLTAAKLTIIGAQARFDALKGAPEFKAISRAAAALWSAMKTKPADEEPPF